MTTDNYHGRVVGTPAHNDHMHPAMPEQLHPAAADAASARGKRLRRLRAVSLICIGIGLPAGWLAIFAGQAIGPTGVTLLVVTVVVTVLTNFVCVILTFALAALSLFTRKPRGGDGQGPRT